MPSYRESYKKSLEGEQADNPVEQATERAIEEKLSEQSEQRPAEPVQIEPPEPRPQQQEAPEAVKEWARQHPEYFVPNSAEHHRALAADIEAREAGHVFGSESYLDNIETALGLRKKAPQAPRPQPLPRNSYATMAPVTRESPSWTTGKTAPSRTEVSAEEADLARTIGISIEEYRLQKERLNNLKASGVIQQ